MAGFLSFLFLLLVIWALLHCLHAFLRLLGEGLFGRPSEPLKDMRSMRARGPRPCPNPLCRKDNRGWARFCARCGQPLTTSIAADRAA